MVADMPSPDGTFSRAGQVAKVEMVILLEVGAFNVNVTIVQTHCHENDLK